VRPFTLPTERRTDAYPRPYRPRARLLRGLRDRRPPGARGPGRRRLRLWSPQDDGIDRATYFERCWPANETLAAFEFKRLHELGDEVLVTYEAERNDGSRFRNTEILTFAGDQLKLVEVYFGWDL
jgi:hypothetical protein